MGKCFVDPNALLAVAGMLAAIAKGEPIGVEPCKPTRFNQPCGCGRPTPPRDAFGRFVGVGRPVHPVCPPAPRWGVCECEPREDKNKRFGINVGRIDEPVRSDFNSQWAFERAHAKFDRLVDAVEAVDWPNKSNTAPLHKVNCIRRSILEDPVFATGGRNLIGETRWFE